MVEAVVAKDLVKRYTTYLRRGVFKRVKKVVHALKGVSFKVYYGEVFGLLGPNGAGKTTTVKILSTLLLPDSGEAYVAGYNVLSQPEKVRENIGVTLSVERGFFWKLTGRENLKYFGMLKGLRGEKLNGRVNYLLDKLGLEAMGVSDKLYEEYSLGMKARLSLSRALLTDPPILILDEPTLGLDPASARIIRSFLIKLARDENKAVLVTTHNMFEAELICDRVAIIDEGKIVAIGRASELKKKVSNRISVEVLLGGIKDENIVKNILMGLAGKIGISTTIEGKMRVKILCRIGEEEEIVSEIVKRIGGLGCKIYRVDILEPNLEDVFITLTGKREVETVDILDRRV